MTRKDYGFVLEGQQLQGATTNQKKSTERVLIPHLDHILEASSSPSPSFLIPTVFNTKKVSHLDMDFRCCGKHMVSQGPIAALTEPPLGLRQQVCVNFGPQEPGVRVFLHQAVHLPLGLVKAREGGLLHISSCQLPCLEVYVHLGKVAEESLVPTDQFASFKWHICLIYGCKSSNRTNVVLSSMPKQPPKL